MDKGYRVSDGVVSEQFTAPNPSDALSEMFSDYDWGDAPEDIGGCATASSRYTVWEIDEDGDETEVLSGPLSGVRTEAALRRTCANARKRR